MAEFHDLFSTQAACYSRSRPRYPAELFAYLAGLVSQRRLAWDCGTGNGQAAIGLVEHFERVIATDASAAQIAHASPHPRIEYRVAPAENPGLAPGSIDLATVAQALHWLPLDAFYAHVRRVAKPGCILAAWCYNLPRVDPSIDAVCERFYREVTGPYWDSGRRWIDERYQTIPFPFDEIRPTSGFQCRLEWTLPDYVSYLESWSAVQRFKEQRGCHPIDEISDDLSAAWLRPDQRRVVVWPIHLRIGRVPRAIPE